MKLHLAFSFSFFFPALVLVCALALAVGSAARAGANPFAPLSASEMESAVGVLRAKGHLNEGTAIASLMLVEPAKDRARERAPREALAVIVDHAAGKSREVRVALGSGSVVEVRVRGGHDRHSAHGGLRRRALPLVRGCRGQARTPEVGG